MYFDWISIPSKPKHLLLSFCSLQFNGNLVDAVVITVALTLGRDGKACCLGSFPFVERRIAYDTLYDRNIFWLLPLARFGYLMR